VLIVHHLNWAVEVTGIPICLLCSSLRYAAVGLFGN